MMLIAEGTAQQRREPVQVPDLDFEGERFVFCVGQKPFEHESRSGHTHLFASLVPLLHSDGTEAFAGDFPDTGNVWWMIRPSARGFASEPGRLVTGVLERSQEFGAIGKAHYQVNVDSVDLLRPKHYIELLEILPGTVSSPEDLVRKRTSVVLDHIPMESVYLLWRGDVYGPFSVKSEPDEAGRGWTVSFRPDQTDSSVIRFGSSSLLELESPERHQLEATVSLEAQSPADANQTRTCRFHLVEAKAFRSKIPSGADRLVLRTVDEILRKLARDLLSRKEKQAFIRNLDNLGTAIEAAGSEEILGHAEILEHVRNAVDQNMESAAEAANSILSSGLLDKQVEAAIQKHTQEFVDNNEARLQAEINKRVSATREKLEELRKKEEELEADMIARRAEADALVEKEIAKQRDVFAEEISRERRQLQFERDELEKQRALISKNLEGVSQRMGEERDELINQFLALHPLLQKLGVLSPGLPSDAGATPEPEVGGSGAASDVFRLPSYVDRGDPTDTQAETPTEQAFFERFCNHVEARGYRYRRIDLASFHVSVKCGDMTILGGLPGTGKSSLPRLYAEALLGDRWDDESDRFLKIHVSASWLDIRDLIGHVNTIDRVFQPAESGLFQQLVTAHEEYFADRSRSGMYITCLDEMNLAHVEHYFSNILQLLDSNDTERRIRCFASEVVDPGSTFARWPSVVLTPATRFVGTVNFDETTRQLSQRLLDRANVLILRSNELPLELAEPTSAKAVGDPIRVGTYRSWITSGAEYSPLLGEVLDQIRGALISLGSPMNPRRFNAMRRFIRNYPEDFGTEEEAVDLQIAQRILPQIRNLFRSSAVQALETVEQVLESSGRPFSESQRVLGHIRMTEGVVDSEFGED